MTNKDFPISERVNKNVPVTGSEPLTPTGVFMCYFHGNSEHKNSVVSLNNFAWHSRGNFAHKHSAPDSNTNKEKSNSLPTDCYFLRQRSS